MCPKVITPRFLSFNVISNAAVKRSLLSSRPPTDDYPAFLDLYPGELPGYTGWARPEHTLVNLFQLVKSDGNNPQVGQDWRIRLKCTSEKCATSSMNRGALFYARAYGPAVIPGYVTSPVRDEGGQDIYTIMLHFLDEGAYVVEVVLTFSESYAFEDYPLISQKEPSYEGYMVQGFPMQVTVTSAATADANLPNSPRAWCTAEQLELGDNIHQQISFARWRVYDKNSHSLPKSRTPNSKVVSLEGYQHGFNSLGIKMDYLPATCSVIRQHELMNSTSGEHILDACLNASTVLGAGHKTFRLIFVGDSVMDLQHVQMWQDMMCGMKNFVNVHTLIRTHGGIKMTIDNVKREMNSLLTSGKNAGEKRIVIFNTGLHDLDKLCAHQWAWERKLRMNITDDNFSCVEMYRKNFQELVNFIGSYDASVKIFRTTTAGWHKYGNYGFGWPPDCSQPFPFSTHMTYRFNEVALEVIKTSGFDNIHILDGYWLTLSRPDNTQVKTERNEIGAHLVHYGPEVVGVMNRQLFMLILHDVCPMTLARWPSLV
eukprot:CAMPEP_0172417734 /NCGR_PEP_ID=MMETSP1064-20121228/4240_1 /TAXON_ID=202472 /ORGANISM="Aulacoseira subarctica , Strain CCAP 1002/5" /LENGTH=540 /DNA_ID=CAMNT_0013156229 /DNA_START=303 /DNA_END=1924 /DNA_ORIENTATION=-